MEAVQVVEASLVVPSEETPRHRLWVSNLDVATVASGHIPIVYLYRRPDSGAPAGFSDVGRLRAALAKALVPFYPLAGRLVVDGDGRPEIDCCAEGALLVVARSELTVDGVRELELSPEKRRLFVPAVDSAEPRCLMLAVQVTFLKCGGAVVGTALHHVAVDAPSSKHFLRTWSNLSNAGTTAVELPCHDRGLLRARSQPAVDAGILSVFSPKMTHCEVAGPVSAKFFDISREQVAALKRLYGGASAGTTTFRALAAHAWRCACAARGLAPDRRARLHFLASVRRHIRPRLPERYFGNTAFMLTASAAVRDVVSGTLASVAGLIGRSVDRLNDDFVRSAIDYLELAEADEGDEPTRKYGLPETELRVVSWLGMPTYDADFGWGKPEFIGHAQMMRGSVVLMSGPADDGNVRMAVCLELSTIKVFEKLLYAMF